MSGLLNEFYTEFVLAVLAADDEEIEVDENMQDDHVDRINHNEAKLALELITAYIEHKIYHNQLTNCLLRKGVTMHSKV